MFKQIIIARKDLNMSPGKLAAQVSHASMAFLSRMIRNNIHPSFKYSTYPSFKIIKDGEYDDGAPKFKKVQKWYVDSELCKYSVDAFEKGLDTFTVENQIVNGKLEHHLVEHNEVSHYNTVLQLDKDLYEQWFRGVFTKIVLGAKNKNQLLKAIQMANLLGMKENQDYFLIKDNCYTELNPEETDEYGIGRTLTCIGFIPMDAMVIDQIAKKYQMY